MLGIFLDTETNGLNPQSNSICEIAYQIINLNTGLVMDTFNSFIQISEKEWEKSNPNSLKINGLSWDILIKNGRSKYWVAEAIIASFKKTHIHRAHAVFICQNPSFDRAFFSQIINPDLQESMLWPYHWLDLASMYWITCLSKHQSPWKTGISKNAIAQSFGLSQEAMPHRAMNGVDHLILCYNHLLNSLT